MRRVGRAASALLLVTAVTVVGATGPATVVGAADTTGFTLYVGAWNDATLVPVAVDSQVAGTPTPVGLSPAAVAITPDGATAFVANFGSNSVTPVDTATGVAAPAVDTGSDTHPVAVAISPDGRTVWVLAQGITDGALVPVDVATRVAGAPVVLTGTTPAGLAITPDGTTAFVTDNPGGTVIPVDLGTRAVGAPITVGANPGGPAITPDGALLFVPNATDGTVTPVDVASRTALAAITVGALANWVSITPDGRTALVATGDPDHSVRFVDVATLTAGVAVPVGDNPAAIAITPDGATAFVGNFALEDAASTVVAIDLATRTAGAPFTVGSNPASLAISPDQAPLARLAVRSVGAPGTSTEFDASASTVRYGTIASYAWDFGDGSSPVVTASPVVEHSYATVGNYVVTLTETSSAGTSTRVVFTGQTVSNHGGPSAVTTATVAVGSQVLRFTG